MGQKKKKKKERKGWGRKKKWWGEREFPLCLRGLQIWLTSMRMWVQSLAPLSGLRIQHFHELWCRLMTWPGSHIAVSVLQASSCKSDLTPSLGTSICRRYSPKKKKKEKNSLWTRSVYIYWALNMSIILLTGHNFWKWLSLLITLLTHFLLTTGLTPSYLSWLKRSVSAEWISKRIQRTGRAQKEEERETRRKRGGGETKGEKGRYKTADSKRWEAKEKGEEGSRKQVLSLPQDMFYLSLHHHSTSVADPAPRGQEKKPDARCRGQMQSQVESL